MRIALICTVTSEEKASNFRVNQQFSHFRETMPGSSQVYHLDVSQAQKAKELGDERRRLCPQHSFQNPILSSDKNGPGTGLLLSRECSSHVTTYFRTFVWTFESMLCRGSNIRVKVIGGTRTNKTRFSISIVYTHVSQPFFMINPLRDPVQAH